MHHPTSSISATKVAIAPQKVVASPYYPSIDREIFKEMFNNFTDALDQKLKMLLKRKWSIRRKGKKGRREG
jgi:hypothetical protein